MANKMVCHMTNFRGGVSVQRAFAQAREKSRDSVERRKIYMHGKDRTGMVYCVLSLNTQRFSAEFSQNLFALESSIVIMRLI